MFRVIATVPFVFIACAIMKGPVTMTQPKKISFSYLEETFMVVPVVINGKVAQDFIFDTGIGLNLISQELCKQLDCKIEGEHKGQRMSGQEVRVPMSEVQSLALGEQSEEWPSVGVFDLKALMPGAKIGGFLSLGFFRNRPHTVDYQKKLIVFETPTSLEMIRSEGVRVPIRIDIKGLSYGILMPLVLPNGHQIWVQVDTGSQALILNDSFMSELGIAPNGVGVRQKDGKDETGHTYSRFFTKLQGSILVPQSSVIKSDQPDVMFQKIIYEGLVGHNFLSRFLVTYDLENSEMIFRLQRP